MKYGIKVCFGNTIVFIINGVTLETYFLVDLLNSDSN